MSFVNVKLTACFVVLSVAGFVLYLVFPANLILLKSPVPATPSLAYFHDFGVVSPNVTLSHSFEVFNQDSVPWRATEIVASCVCTVAKAPTHEVKVGDKIVFPLTLNISNSDKDVTQTVLVRRYPETLPDLQLSVSASPRFQMSVEPAQLKVDFESDTTEFKVKVINRSETTWADVKWGLDSPVSNFKLVSFRNIRLTRVADSEYRGAREVWETKFVLAGNAVGKVEHLVLRAAPLMDIESNTQGDDIEATIQVLATSRRALKCIPRAIVLKSGGSQGYEGKTVLISSDANLDDLVSRLEVNPFPSESPGTQISLNIAEGDGKLLLSVTVFDNDVVPPPWIVVKLDGEENLRIPVVKIP